VKPLLLHVLSRRQADRETSRAVSVFSRGHKILPSANALCFLRRMTNYRPRNEKHSFFHFDITAQSKTLFLIRPLRFMSASGTKRTFLFAPPMSAIGGKAAMPFCTANVRLPPKPTWADGPSCGTFLWLQLSIKSHWSHHASRRAKPSRNCIDVSTRNLARRCRKRLDKSTEEIEAAVVKVGNNAASLAKELQAKRA
jgi:hypothetical protein